MPRAPSEVDYQTNDEAEEECEEGVEKYLGGNLLVGGERFVSLSGIGEGGSRSGSLGHDEQIGL